MIIIHVVFFFIGLDTC